MPDLLPSRVAQEQVLQMLKKKLEAVTLRAIRRVSHSLVNKDRAVRPRSRPVGR